MFFSNILNINEENVSWHYEGENKKKCTQRIFRYEYLVIKLHPAIIQYLNMIFNWLLPILNIVVIYTYIIGVKPNNYRLSSVLLYCNCIFCNL